MLIELWIAVALACCWMVFVPVVYLYAYGKGHRDARIMAQGLIREYVENSRQGKPHTEKLLDGIRDSL